ncbi:hypothetical protein B4098_1781 [Heyndrickxia coagulans]|uniref:Uncharacterized protein n=1 Tax=Heyndrickxia coagulans TaxID=1398 RepID=A0A150JWH9_HEYCO|nr:hypothetical protein B4098_1781 [Heyndrickxia coagulans]
MRHPQINQDRLLCRFFRTRADIKWRNLAPSIVNPASFCVGNMIRD